MSAADTLEHLVKMANQIGSFFESMQDHEKALSDIATHLKRYWDPRMRRALLEHVAKDGGTDLRPMVLEAVKKHEAMLTPAKAVSSQ
ncbi:formate dehydrogenase [Oxalobacteraceae bacterium CAVE-383]|nr:formate dehydrogenase [Oxalobacteraceae bacterium CAVE-383]